MLAAVINNNQNLFEILCGIESHFYIMIKNSPLRQNEFETLFNIGCFLFENAKSHLHVHKIFTAIVAMRKRVPLNNYSLYHMSDHLHPNCIGQ